MPTERNQKGNNQIGEMKKGAGTQKVAGAKRPKNECGMFLFNAAMTEMPVFVCRQSMLCPDSFLSDRQRRDQTMLCREPYPAVSRWSRC